MSRHSTALQWQENQIVIKKKFFDNILSGILNGTRLPSSNIEKDILKNSIAARIANVRLFDNGNMLGNAIINKRGDKIPVKFVSTPHSRKVFNRDSKSFEVVTVTDLSNGFWREI